MPRLVWHKLSTHVSYTDNWMGFNCVETILSEIFIESLERLMHLKRKDSIKLKNIRKWMEGKIPVLHELSIHSGLLPKSDGARNDSLT